jgi:hypothetical protein
VSGDPNKKSELSEIALIMWDGLGFFGFDDRKIARLEGKPVRYRDKFTSMQETPLMIIGLIVAVIIIAGEAGLWINVV